MKKPETPEQLLELWGERQRSNQKAHYLMADKLSRRAFWLGVLAASIAGAVGFLLVLMARYEAPDWLRLLAGGLSIFSSVIGAAITSGKWSDKAAQHHSAGAAYGGVMRRIQETQVLPPKTEKIMRDTLQELREAMDKIPLTAPSIPGRVWKEVPEELTPRKNVVQQGSSADQQLKC